MGCVRGWYGLCIVETTGVSDVAPRTIPSTPAWLWTRSNSPVGGGEERGLGVRELEVLGVGQAVGASSTP